MNILVGGQDQAVAAWAGHELGVTFMQPVAAFGIVDEQSKIKGAAIFNDYYKGGNIELTYLGCGTISRNIIRQLARYAFTGNGVLRVTCKTRKSNVLVRRLLPRLGFRLECTLKNYFGSAKGDSALVFVLHKADAKRWIE